MIKRTLIFFSAILAFTATQAVAGNFSTADIENFIKVNEELKGIEDRYPDADLGINTNDPQAFTKLIDGDGNLIAFQRILKDMPAGPARNDVVNAIKSNGFSSTGEFGPKADAILMTYMSIELSKQDMSGMDQMTPEMIAMMPPEFQEQMGPVIKMLNAAKNVPQEDKDTLTPLLPQVDAVFSN